jgi:hypothetical protein
MQIWVPRFTTNLLEPIAKLSKALDIQRKQPTKKWAKTVTAVQRMKICVAITILKAKATNATKPVAQTVTTLQKAMNLGRTVK